MTAATFAVFVILAVIGLGMYGAWCWLTSYLDECKREFRELPQDHVVRIVNAPYDQESPTERTSNAHPA